MGRTFGVRNQPERVRHAALAQDFNPFTYYSSPFLLRGSGFLFEVFLADAAKRTLPVIGKIRKKCAGLDAVIRIADFFIIDVTANSANKFGHILFSSFLLSGEKSGKMIDKTSLYMR